MICVRLTGRTNVSDSFNHKGLIMMRPLWLDESETFTSGIMCVDGYWDVLSYFMITGKIRLIELQGRFDY